MGSNGGWNVPGEPYVFPVKDAVSSSITRTAPARRTPETITMAMQPTRVVTLCYSIRCRLSTPSMRLRDPLGRLQPPQAYSRLRQNDPFDSSPMRRQYFFFDAAHR